MEENIQVKDKKSPELLNLEFQIAMLVKDQRYKEAHALQKKAENLIDRCRKKNESLNHNTRNSKVEHLLQKQEHELQALMYKVETGREDLIKAREKDYHQLVSKYRVLREKLDDDQIFDYHKTEKTLRNFKPSSNLFNKSMQGGSRLN